MRISRALVGFCLLAVPAAGLLQAAVSRELALAYLQDGKLREALEVAEDVLADGQATGDVRVEDLRLIALLRSRTGARRAARDLRRKLARHRPSSAAHAASLAGFFLEERDAPAATDLIDSALERWPGDRELAVLRLRARALVVPPDPGLAGEAVALMNRIGDAPGAALDLAGLMLEIGRPRDTLHLLAGPDPSASPHVELLRARAVWDATRDRRAVLERGARLLGVLPWNPSVVEPLASLLLEVGAPDLATVALGAHPTGPGSGLDRAVLAARARLELEPGRFDPGALLTAAAAIQAPSSRDLESAADFLLESGWVAQAGSLLETGLAGEEVPPPPSAALLRARIAWRQGEPESAVRTLLEAIGRTESPGPALLQDLAGAWLELEDPRPALEILQRAAPATGREFRHAVLSAAAFGLAGETDRARSVLEGLLARRDPVGPEHARVVEILLDLEELDAAAVVFRRLPDWFTRSWSGRRLAARLALAVPEPDRALVLVETLRAERPRDTAVVEIAGRALLATGRHARARDRFAALLARTPEQPRWILDHARATLGLGRAADALDRLLDLADRMRRRDVRPPGLLELVAAAHAGSGDQERAERLYREALAREGRRPDLLDGLAGILERRGRAAEALNALEQAVLLEPRSGNLAGRTDPGEPEILTGPRRRRRIALARLYRAEGRWRDAWGVYLGLMEGDGRHAGSLVGLREALAGAGGDPRQGLWGIYTRLLDRDAGR